MQGSCITQLKSIFNKVYPIQDLQYIKDFIEKYYRKNTDFDECVSKFFGENSRKDGSWKECNVNFYILLWKCPLWKFNELYNKWYIVKDKKHEAGAMGDFMSDEPTEFQISDYMWQSDIDF